MKKLLLLLGAALMAASGIAPGDCNDPPCGRAQGRGYGPGAGYGYGPYKPGGLTAAELDPVDADARAFPGADGTGFGQWADKDAGAQQPGEGAPWSGIRPPK
jgi:hypothetical protein